MTKQGLYNSLIKWAKTLLSSLVISAAIVPHVSAHLMVAQHGTLNFKNDGAFMVISLPVSAFEGIDDDGDGKMSSKEFSKHKPAIVIAVKNKVKLSDKEGTRPLQGLLLSPVVPHDASKAASEQLVIMGRFALNKSKSENSEGLTFKLGLYGKKTDEKSMIITATRPPNAKQKTQKFKAVLTPRQSESQLFAL